MISDRYGNMILESRDVAEMIYADNYVEPVLAIRDPQVELFNRYASVFDESYQAIEFYEEASFETVEAYDRVNQANWYMPKSYKTLDIQTVLLGRAPSEEARKRVMMELKLFEKRDLINVLRYLTYLVDTMRENRVTWGVGRGSSLASYCLYLIGVHKVDSIKYNLDFDEFIKE